MYPLTPADADRFWAKVDILEDPDACWNWTASSRSDGYGQFHLGKKQGATSSSHRVAWQLTSGEIPNGLWVLHTCDNRLCCNPNHLYLGTRHDNERDKINRGRQIQRETHPLHKLTDTQVAEVRTRYANGSANQYQLAAEYGVSQSVISRIVNNKAWGGWRHRKVALTRD